MRLTQRPILTIASTQRRWLAKSATRDYFRGPEHVARVAGLDTRDAPLPGSKPKVAYYTGETEYITSPYIIEPARRTMGGIDLDPASTAKAQEFVKAEQYFTVREDGLKRRWGGRVWLNPPYARGILERVRGTAHRAPREAAPRRQLLTRQPVAPCDILHPRPRPETLAHDPSLLFGVPAPPRPPLRRELRALAARPLPIGGRTSFRILHRLTLLMKRVIQCDYLIYRKVGRSQRLLELARCEWIERRENVIALGPSGTGKTHVAQGLGLAACQRGLSVRFVTAAALVHELMEARDERRLLRLQKQFANHKLLIIDELGFVPLSKTGAELLFELVSQRYERAAVLIYESSLRRVDRDVRNRAPDRGAARPTDPSRPYPGNERPELPPQPQPRAKTGSYNLICASPPAGNCGRATPSLRFRLTPPPASSRPPRTISPRRPRWQCFAPPVGLVSLRR